MLLYLFILCMFYILTLLIGMGDGKIFPKPQSEIRFGWGLSYNYIGQLQHNLDKYDVVVGLEIPDFRTVSYYAPFTTDPNYCERWYDSFVSDNEILYETCLKVWPAYLATVIKLDNARERIIHIMENEIPAVIPNYKLKPLEPEPATTTYPTTTERYFETVTMPELRRKKRFIADLISLGIQGFTAFNTNRKVKQLKKGMKRLFEGQHRLQNKVVKLENDMISLAHITMQGLEHLQNELVVQGRQIRNITARVKRMEYEVSHMKMFVADNTNSIRFLANLLGILMSDMNRYLMLYESILSELDHFLDALDNLSNNQLSHSVIPPKEMSDLITHVNEVLKTQYPNYELVVSKVHDYYNLPFSTFACQGNTLMIHISFYIKPSNLESLYMYAIKSIPVPYHMNEELIEETESKYTYTKIKQSTEILAMGSNSQINLDYNQLVHCIQYNILFFCEQMFLAKVGNEHTCESAIYTHQNSKMIQQKCDIEYYPDLNPEPELLNAGNYLVLGNFPLPWNYFCAATDEIPKPIHGSSYVILKKHDLCQCSLTAGSWYLEANIAYCTQEPGTELTLYYTVNMATVIYQFKEKLKTEGITDLTLYLRKIDFDPEEPNLIIEEDPTVLDKSSPAVNYKEVMSDFGSEKFLTKPDLAMSMSEVSHWFEGQNSWLTFVGISAILVIIVIPVIMFTLYKYCGVRFQFQKVNAILTKLLLLNKTTETIKPVQATTENDITILTFHKLDIKLIQIVLMVMLLALTCYLVFKLVIWTFDYLNTKYLHISSTGLTCMKTLTLDKTNVYLQLYDFTTCENVNMYMGTILGNPEDIYCVGHFTEGSVSLDKKSTCDFIDLNWNTVALSLKGLDLHMPKILQVSRWKKAKVRQIFKSNNSFYRIVAHNPNARKVRSVTDAYSLHDETMNENVTFVQTSELEVIVTGNQHTVTFNDITEEPETNEQSNVN